jgi:pentatricopeptide repeat protein
MIRGEISGVSPDTVSFSTLLAAHARTGTTQSAKSAEILLNQMLELYDNGVESAKPNSVSFTNVIHCFAQQGNPAAAKKWLKKLENIYMATQDEDLKPDVTAYNTCLLAFTHCGDPEGGEHFLKSSIPPYVQPNERSFNTVLSAWARAGDPYRAEATLLEMHDLHVNGALETKPTVVSYNTVLSAYAKLAASISTNKRHQKQLPLDDEDEPWRRAESILNHMDTLYQMGDEKVKPNERTLNTVIDVCAKSGRPDVAERLLKKFDEKAGGKPSVRTWNTLLSACMYLADLPRAKRLWANMMEQAAPDIVSYNTLLNCYVRASMKRKRGQGGKFGISKQQEASTVEAIYKHLQDNQHVAPNRITHLAMINFWISRDEPERAEEYLLQIANITKQQKTINTACIGKKDCWVSHVDQDLFHKVMAAWIPRKLPKKAESLLLKMADLEAQGLNLRPNVDTYNVLLECWAKSGKIEAGERAEVILREMEALSQNGDKDVKPNILTYNRVLNAWANSKNPTSVTRSDSLILEMILKQDPKTMPDAYSYGTWLKAISLSKDVDKPKRAKDVRKMMKIHDFNPTNELRKKMDSLNNSSSNSS